ncbi:MAG: Asp23/Gls24 family envelope stress response protein [Clostridiales bacterium]|nr:Asp23/Gls24 family envelope stress response protein [Clostridiales bacterium]
MSNPMEITGLHGKIKVSSDVILTIMKKVVEEIEGIILIKGSLSKEKIDSINVENIEAENTSTKEKEKSLIVSIFIATNYGIIIPKVVREVQEKVKEEIEIMTGVQVGKINVFVQTVKL